MKKFLKTSLSLLMAMALIVSSFAFTAIQSNAQVVAKDVSVAFTGAAKEDYVTMSGTTIQDPALAVMVYNDGEEQIELTAIESNGTSIVYSDYSQGMKIDAYQTAKIGISGTTTNNAVLSVTVTYRVTGNPVSTLETCTAYIYCSSQSYSEAVVKCGIDSSFGVYGVHTKMTLGPLSSSSVPSESASPSTTASIYIDGSKYKTWGDFNLHMSIYEDDTRDHAFFDKITVTQTSSTGSFLYGGYGSTATEKSVTSTYDEDAATGFYINITQENTVDTAFSGTIPTEASSTVTMTLRGYGQTGGIAGVLAVKTKELTPTFTFTIYNNDKSAIRQRLDELSLLGLNSGSYTSDSWNTYESALKKAYIQLGTVQTTAANVSSALSTLNTAYNNLVRYVTVITNQYYYSGKDNTNPVLITRSYDLQIPNGSQYAPVVLQSDQYAEYPFNRQNTSSSVTVTADDATDYTFTVNQYYWKVDTSALEAAIQAQADKIHIDSDGNEMYTDDSWQAYVKAAESGKTVLNDTTLFQADIDAAVKVINNAKNSLVRLAVDTDWMDEGIAWAECILYNDYYTDPGYGWDTDALFLGDAMTKKNLLEQAYNTAQTILADPEFQKADADAAAVDLWNAIYNLYIVDNTTKGLITSGGIRFADVSKYGYYQSLRDQTSDEYGLKDVFLDVTEDPSAEYDRYSLNESDFTPESWYMLQDALYGSYEQGLFDLATTEEPYEVDSDVGELYVPAYSMINNIWYLASQADYNACRDNVINKINNLEYVLDSTALDEVCATAETIETSEYTAVSVESYQEVLVAAQDILAALAEPQLYGNENVVTQEQIDKAAADLQAAIEALDLIPLIDPIGDGVQINSTGEVTGVSQSTTVAEAIADFDIIKTDSDGYKGEYRIEDNDGNVCTEDEAVGTGYTLYLSYNGVDYDSHQFIILGDVDGNAAKDDVDFWAVYNYSLDLPTSTALEGIYFKAADMNGDGIVDLCDAIMIKGVK